MATQVYPQPSKQQNLMPRNAGGRVSIIDVAEAAGVSRQTVSNVINTPSRVAAATMNRVEKAIADLDYRPSATAQQLRLGAPASLEISWVAVNDPVALLRTLETLTRVASEMSRDVVLKSWISARTDRSPQKFRDRPSIVLYESSEFDTNDLADSAIAVRIPGSAESTDQVREMVERAVNFASLRKS